MFKQRNNKKVIQILNNDGIGIMPTDTLYGIVGSAFSKKAVARIFKLKKRNPKKPPIVLIRAFSDLARFGIIVSREEQEMLSRVWPGKVSVILPCPHSRFRYLHRGTKTLAFRMPRATALRAMLAKTGPLIAPSANLEGLPPSSTIQEARAYFKDNIDFYSSVGRRIVSKPSTLVALEKGKFFIKRAGAFHVKILTK